MRTRRLVSIMVLLLTFVSLYTAQDVPQQSPTDWATIVGQVLDPNGRPVAQAKITYFPLDVAISGPLPSGAITDQNGHYRLKLPAFHGRTRLCAVKESAGYPDTQGLLFVSGKENMPEISLTPGAYLENVDIHLGAPDGILRGAIVDEITGTPVTKARITLRRKDPESMYSTTVPNDGQFTFALPEAPIEVKVDAPGYVAWHYQDPINSTNGLVLASEESKTIGIKMRQVK